MSKRLFVGGLPFSVDNTQLEEIFSKFGKIVSAAVITDRYSGRSKGFGFVEMEDDKEADEAIKALDQSEMDGRKIAVNVARPREERGPRNYDSQRRGGFGGGRGRDDRRGGGDRRSGGFRRGGNR